MGVLRVILRGDGRKKVIVWTKSPFLVRYVGNLL